MLSIKRLNVNDKEIIKNLFLSVFTQAPWYDDWSDKNQLDLCITDLIGHKHSLTFGLYDDKELIGISMGYIKHWYSGTEYILEEFCIKTDRQGAGAGTFFISEIEKAIKEMGLNQIFLLTERDFPSYKFYKKNGFDECSGTAAFAKRLED